MSGGAGEAFVTKTMLTVQRFHDLFTYIICGDGSSSFTVGTLQNVSVNHTTYQKLLSSYNSIRGADELLLSDGTNSLVGTDDGSIRWYLHD